MKWLSLGVGYAHESVGGTEMYIHRLNLALRARGVDATSAFFGRESKRGTFEGVPIIQLEKPAPPSSRMELWASEPRGLEQFQAVLREVQPEVVHFHSTIQVHAPEYFEAARAMGARTLWTYHSPGQTCLQTALLRNGHEPCDGRIETERCTRCGLVWSHVPPPLATAFSKVDLSPIARFVPARARHPFERRAGTELHGRRFAQAARSVDRWIIHSRWCGRLLAENGVPHSSLFELPLPPPLIETVAADPSVWAGLPGKLRILFAGRLLDIKGAHVLLEALRGPLKDEELALVLLAPPHRSPYAQSLQEQVAREPRARIVSNIGPEGTLAAMAAAHIVVVPSLWLETGPYTVVEALWNGAHVVGSDRGGIPERLEAAPGSLLFSAGNKDDLARAIKALAPVAASDSEREGRAAAYRAAYHAKFEDALDRLVSELATSPPTASNPAGSSGL